MSDFDFKGVSDFFNVREANPNTECGEWEVQATFGWGTFSGPAIGRGRGGGLNQGAGRWLNGGGGGGNPDDYTFVESAIRYGVTDDIFVELGLMPINLGDGDEQGNGDLRAVAFWRFLRESDNCPAAAVWAAMRVPSGDGSSGVDGEIHGNVTKQVASRCRVHFEGWIKTSNGGRGQYDDDRRHFHWGVGPGTDFELDDCNLLVLNYVNRNSEFYGNHNLNILEVGWVHKFNECSNLKVGMDVGLDGAEETPNFLAKVQYAYSWK
jgi:hypothetical protein